MTESEQAMVASLAGKRWMLGESGWYFGYLKRKSETGGESRKLTSLGVAVAAINRKNQAYSNNQREQIVDKAGSQ